MAVIDKSVTVNNEQELYVIPSGRGFTCLGFDVCLRYVEKLSSWISQHESYERPEVSRGSIEAYQTYLDLLGRCSSICLKKNIRCEVALTPKLIGLEGKRVEATFEGGEKRRFYVGKSCGWLPVHLEVARRDSSGGAAVVGKVVSVRVLY